MIKYKLLIADDEPIILDGISEIIGNKLDNVEIVEKCYDGETAIEFLKDNNVDFVITDINMPKKSGIEILKYIRGSKRDIRCVLITGYEQFESAVDAIKYKADGFLQKPLQFKEIITTLNKFIGEKERSIQNVIEMAKFSIEKRNYARDAILIYTLNHLSFASLCERLASHNIESFNYFDSFCKYLKFSWIGNELENLDAFKDAFEFLNSDLDVYVISENINEAYLVCIYSDNRCCEEFLTQNITMMESIYNIKISTELIYEGKFEKINEIGFVYIVNIYFDAIITSQNSFLNKLHSILINDFDFEIKKKIVYQLIKKGESYTDIDKYIVDYRNIKNDEDIGDLLERYQNELLISISSQNIKLNQILNYLSQNCKNDFSLVSVADKFDISPTYLSKLIKKEKGKSFLEIVTDIKMNNAKKMLASGISTDEVCEMVGYSSVKYFSKIFKDRTGITPKEYKMFNSSEK